MKVVYVFFSDSFILYSCSCHVLLAEFRASVNLTGFHVFALMHVFAQIFYFRTVGDAFSQKQLNVVYVFFSDSCVLYSCSCHVLLAEYRTSVNLTAFMCSQLCTYSHRYSSFVQAVKHSHIKKNERSLIIFFFLIALLYISVAAMCFLLKHLCRSLSCGL